jgi:hypothetical protein
VPLSNSAFPRRIAALLITLLVDACSHDMAGPGNGVDSQTADIAFCGEPTWVAFQDGDGAWTRAVAMRVGSIATLHHIFTKGRAGIAIARESNGGMTALSIFYGAPNELSTVSDTAGVACGATSSRTLHGTVIGLDTNEVALVLAGRGVDPGFVSAATGPDFDLRGLRPGPHDFLATRTAIANGKQVVNRVTVRRAPDLPDQAILAPMDFRSTEALPPVAHTLTLTGPDAAGSTGFVALRTAHGIADQLAAISTTGTATTTQYLAIPDQQLVSGDLQSITMTSAPSANVVRSTTVYFHFAADRSIALPGIPTSPALSVASTGRTLAMRARFDVATDYDRLTSITYQQGENTIVIVTMTATYAARNPGLYDLVVPDLLELDGFDSHWALQPGIAVRWTSARFGGTLGPTFNAVPSEGSTRRTATDAGVFTP